MIFVHSTIQEDFTVATYEKYGERGFWIGEKWYCGGFVLIVIQYQILK